MASALNEESVEKKLQNVTNAQDSIQTLSLWIIHHKAHHKKIVRLWFKVLRKAKIPQRLTLFYLCNDVVQHGRKKATVYLESFQGILKLAVEYVRDASIRQSILRLLKIWEERSVFKGPFIEELRSSVSSDKDLSAEKPKPAEEPAKPKVQVDQKILAEFKPQKVFDKMSSFKRFEAEVELRSRQLAHLRLDASSIEAVKQLKDRAHGNEFRKQFEDSCVKLNEFVGSFEKEVSDRKALIASLEQGELFYQAQFGEAKIVTNAYKIFGTKLNNLKKKLDELKKTLPEPLSPLPSPSVDAPSPMSTPTYEPDTQAVDMEMSDEETAATRTQDKPGVGKSHDSTTTTKSFLKPIPSVTEIRTGQKAESMEEESTPKKPLVSFTISKTPTKPAVAVKPAVSDNLDARIATMLPALGQNKDQPSGSRDSTQWNGNTSKKSEDLNATASSIPSQFKALSVNNDTPEDGGGTPLKDEGSSTPVQDEAPEPQPSNPIEFLTKLISQTKKTNPQSSHFLQNLGILATTMKNKSEKPKPLNHDSSSSEDVSSPGKTQPPQSWSAWKAKQTHDKSPVNGQEGDVSPTYSALPQPPVSVPSQLPGPVPPPISPSGMVGGYGASAMPVPVPDPQQLTPPVMPPVGPPSPNIPSMPDISIPPPWLPMSQPPRPPHISQPTSPIGVPPPVNAGPINLGLGPINLLSGPRPVNMGPGHINTGSEFNAVPDLHSDFITATSMEDVPQQDESPSWSGPVIDLYSPPPAINTKPSPAPKGILRNRNSALKEVKLVPLSDTEDQSMLISAISTVAGGRSRSSSGSSQPTSPITGPKPPPHPPGNLLPSGRRTSNSEDRLEFIEKLKRKTSQASGDADTSQQLPKPQVFCKDPGRPNLTTIVLTGDSDNGASAGADVADEEESTMEEEEPVGAPISTIDRAQAPRTINPIVDLGRPDSRQPPRFDDIRHSGNLPRNYEYHERREGFRERRDRFQDRRLPPHDRYVDPYRDPYYYPRPDPYGHPPPPKRPFPDPYYDRGRPPYHPHRY